MVTALAGLLSLDAGRGWGALWVVAAVGSGQLAVGWSNDWLDRDQDRARGRTDKPLASDEVDPATVRNAAVAALVACVPFSLASGPASALAHLGAVASALAYNAGLKARPVSPLPYAVSFGLLPAVVTLGPPLHRWPQLWVMAVAALLGVGGHFTQVLRDIPEDRRRGVRGLPQILGQRASAIAAGLLLLGATAIEALAPGPAPASLTALAVAAVAAGGIVTSALSGRPVLAFRLTLGAAAVAVLGFLLAGRSI
ncbi:MAG: UbiA family prenyltransferase [Candidatus Dormibacteraeota bacterium]|nr:UbiA family prenyltransferase [Candidatus Dormibacteraeota bacterium]